jgi:hypothetical protein
LAWRYGRRLRSVNAATPQSHGARQSCGTVIPRDPEFGAQGRRHLAPPLRQTSVNYKRASKAAEQRSICNEPETVLARCHAYGITER